MQIYLPIAEIPINLFLIMGLGLVTGFLAGMFGIGGGFLATPFLIFIGISPAVAVATSANQIVAASVSGVMAQLKKGSVDIKMGIFLLIGGVIGSTFGVSIFKMLQKTGQIDIVIGLTYVLFLGSISILMLYENFKRTFSDKYLLTFDESAPQESEKKPSSFDKFLNLLDKLPYKTYFPKSAIEISAIVPLFLSFIIGILVALMGIGGGFLMIPMMIYILRMPSNVVVGTSLFQIIFIASNTTFLQAYSNHTVDIILAFILIVSSSIGAQLGTRAGYKIDADKMRTFLAFLIFAVSVKMLLSLVSTPASLYVIDMLK